MELASICRRAHTELEGTAILSRSRGRDRWFESTFLQRRVACEPGFLSVLPRTKAVPEMVGLLKVAEDYSRSRDPRKPEAG